MCRDDNNSLRKFKTYITTDCCRESAWYAHQASEIWVAGLNEAKSSEAVVDCMNQTPELMSELYITGLYGK